MQKEINDSTYGNIKLKNDIAKFQKMIKEQETELIDFRFYKGIVRYEQANQVNMEYAYKTDAWAQTEVVTVD